MRVFINDDPNAQRFELQITSRELKVLKLVGHDAIKRAGNLSPQEYYLVRDSFKSIITARGSNTACSLVRLEEDDIPQVTRGLYDYTDSHIILNRTKHACRIGNQLIDEIVNFYQIPEAAAALLVEPGAEPEDPTA